MYSTLGAEPFSHQQPEEKPESGRSADSFQVATPASLPLPPPPPKRSGKLSIDDITKFFSLPIAEAASILGVSDNVLKRICRENGIVRWPYRKFLAGKTVEVINKNATREKTNEVDELSSSSSPSLAETFGSHIDNRAPGFVQNTNKLEQGVHMSGKVFQTQGNKFAQYGWSGIPQSLQPKNISTYMDEFEFGFPSNGLSSVSMNWWIESGSEDSRMLQGQSMDTKLDKQKPCVAANETNSSFMMDERTDSNLEDTSNFNEASALLCFLRKRSAEYGQEALKNRISKDWDSFRLTRRQKLLFSQVFNASLPSQ